MTSEYDYIVYVDEAGETGLKKIVGIDENGSSEWLVLAVSLIRVEREKEAVAWGRELSKQCGTKQTEHFHFRKAPENKQLLACERLATHPIRHFVICSNKKNIKNYSNPFAAQRHPELAGERPRKGVWLYYWLTKMLLERVSSYVYYRSMKDHGEPRKVKIEFSERGGINYDEIKGYLQLIKNQELMGQSFLQSGQINWDVIDPELVEVYAHKTRISMIFPDIVASAFYKACDKYERNKPVDPRAAIRLEPRMCRPKDQASRSAAGFGVKLMPAPKNANLEKDQEQIFRFYGYKF